ncbi:MAG: TetR/AcrR family transcriptional regulator [Actinobacteria bacterium]|nr:TetR/AcrR family transcriptional regulator [Actinomycetota bacterium]
MLDSKSKILISAENLFAKKGYDAVSVLEIANDAGISKSLIFHHFKNKQNILISLVESKLKIIEAKINEIIDSKETTAKNKLYEFVNIYIELLIEHSALFKILFREIVNANENISKAIVAHNASVANVIKQIIQTGLESGEIKKSVDPDYFAILLLLSMNSLVAVETLQGSDSNRHFHLDVNKLREELIKTIVKGVVCDD